MNSLEPFNFSYRISSIVFELGLLGPTETEPFELTEATEEAPETTEQAETTGATD